MTEMAKQKKEIKTKIMMETNSMRKYDLIGEYKVIQSKCHEQILKEKTEETTKKIEKIITDGSLNSLWKEKKKCSQNPALESCIIKDAQGKRIFDPEEIKEQTALYYETLYKDKFFEPHPYHDDTNNLIANYVNNKIHDDARFNQIPSYEEPGRGWR